MPSSPAVGGPLRRCAPLVACAALILVSDAKTAPTLSSFGSRATALQLQGVGRENARELLGKLVQLTAAEQRALARTNAPRVVPEPVAESAIKAPASIPDLIEHYVSTRSYADALAPYGVMATLITVEPNAAPFAIDFLRLEGQRHQVRFTLVDPSGAGRPLPGWFEVGDSPAPGWRVAQIASSGVVLLTPKGNPVRLLARPDAGAAPVGLPGEAAPESDPRRAGQS